MTRDGSVTTANGASPLVLGKRDAWKHFCDILDLSENERKLLEGQAIKSPSDWHLYGSVEALEARTSVLASEDELFAFDEERLIRRLIRKRLILAWHWLDYHAETREDWAAFCSVFCDSFLSEVKDRKRKAAVEAEEADLEEEKKRHRTTPADQKSASSSAMTYRQREQEEEQSRQRSSQRLAEAHGLLTVPKSRKFMGTDLVTTKTKYGQWACSGCSRRVRTYCACTPGVIRCVSCYSTHLVNVEKEE